MLSVARGPHTRCGLTAVLVAAGVCAAAAAQMPRLAWRTAIQSADREFELRAAAVSRDGSSLWIGVAARPRGKIGGAESIVLTSVTTAGKPTGRMLDASSDAALGDLVERRGLIGMSSGRESAIVLGLDRRSAGPGFTSLDTASGRVAAAKPLPSNLGTPDIARMVSLPDGRALAVGAVGAKPFVSRFAADGAVEWQRVLDQDNINLDDGAATSDGGLIVTGREGADPSATRVWVAKLSAKGEIERQAAFDGWLGAIAQGTSGGYLLVLTERARAGNVTLTGLGPALETKWTRQIPAGQPTTPAWRVAPVRGGGFVLAGVKDRGVWVSRVGEDGAAVWTEGQAPGSPPVEPALNVELLSHGDAYYVLYTVFAVEGKEQRQLVRVMRFAA